MLERRDAISLFVAIIMVIVIIIVIIKVYATGACRLQGRPFGRAYRICVWVFIMEVQCNALFSMCSLFFVNFVYVVYVYTLIYIRALRMREY